MTQREQIFPVYIQPTNHCSGPGSLSGPKLTYQVVSFTAPPIVTYPYVWTAEDSETELVSASLSKS